MIRVNSTEMYIRYKDLRFDSMLRDTKLCASGYLCQSIIRGLHFHGFRGTTDHQDCREI